MKKLTDNQRAFCNEYLIDLNATRAYKVAYKTCKKDDTARANASRLLTKANIKAYIDERMREREKRTEVTQDKVVKELAKIGFSNIADFATTDGQSVNIKPTDLIDKNKIGAISSIKQGQNGIEIKLYDKIKSLELLGKHLGIFDDSKESEEELNKLDKLIEGINNAAKQ